MNVPTPASIREQHEKFLQKLERMQASGLTQAPKDGVSTVSLSTKSQGRTEGASKPFIRKPHLTQKPLAQHEGLTALRDQLTSGKKRPTSKKVAAVKSHKKESK